jgi:hypothetical protein
MATSNQQLVRDASTLANYKAWGQAISNFFATAGWSKSSDSGQVNWSTISTVPSNSITRDYEIWTPGDGLQAFYLKIQYGTSSASSNTSPLVQFTLSSATNGSGTPSGFITGSFQWGNGGVNVTSTSTQWQCYFSGDSGRMCILMWRDDTTGGAPSVLVIQRSLNASGATYGTSTTGYVTMVGTGGAQNAPNFQQSLVFNVGVSNPVQQSTSNQNALVILRNTNNQSSATQLFNGSASISPVFPDVGFFDNPMDAVAIGAYNDFTEGSQYTIAAGNMPYGVSHNYIAAKNVRLDWAFFQPTGAKSCWLVRYD